MSSRYAFGAFTENEITEGFDTTSSMNSALEILFEKSGINMLKHFNYYTSEGDEGKHLFYTYCDELQYDEFEVGFSVVDMDYPVVFGDKSRVYLIKNFLKSIDYNGIIDLNITPENITKILKDKPYEERFLKSLVLYYNRIMSWIKDNKNIFYYWSH